MCTEYAEKQRSSYMSCVLLLFLLLGIAVVLVRGLFVRWPDRVVATVMWFIFGSMVVTILCLAGHGCSSSFALPLIILIAGSVAIQLICILRVERQGKHSLSRYAYCF